MNKELCQRCHAHLEVEWKQSDDLRWEKGVVACPARGWAPSCFKWADSVVPLACPYYFEQVVLGQSSLGKEAP